MKKTGEETVTYLKNMKIIQRNDFQNFTLDSVLLADFLKINRKSKKILDIGTGCGIIPLLLSQRTTAEITGIEIYKEMSEIAKRNITNNSLQEKITIINEDIKNYRNIFKRDQFDTVVTNPPYFEFKGDVNQVNRLEQLAYARHNVNITLEEIIKISAFLLKNSGSFSLVFRSERLVEVLALLTEYKLEPKRLKICFTKRSGAAKISLIEAIKAAERGLKIEPPLFVYDETGEKSEYIKNLYK